MERRVNIRLNGLTFSPIHHGSPSVFPTSSRDNIYISHTVPVWSLKCAVHQKWSAYHNSQQTWANPFFIWLAASLSEGLSGWFIIQLQNWIYYIAVIQVKQWRWKSWIPINKLRQVMVVCSNRYRRADKRSKSWNNSTNLDFEVNLNFKKVQSRVSNVQNEEMRAWQTKSKQFFANSNWSEMVCSLANQNFKISAF